MSASASPPPFPKTVVLVDDEIAYVDLLAQMLGEYLSAPARGFTSPREALQSLPHLNVGLIITDYQMPEMNGLAFSEQAQKICPDVPILVITGHPLRLTECEKNALTSLRAVINKPFKWRALAEEISRHWLIDATPVSSPSQIVPSAAPANHF